MKYRSIVCTIILFMVLSITVGFSAFVSEMSISKIVADVKIVEDVRITNVEFLSSESVGVNPVDLSYDKDSVLGRLSFDSISSAAVYKITVTNFGNADVYFNGMVNISPVRVEFVDGGADVKISPLGGTYEFKITVFQIEHSDYESDFKVDFDFKRLFNVSYENIDMDNEVVVEGENYYTYLNANYDLSEVKIFMGGREITSDEIYYDGYTITIYNVSGNIVFKGPKTLNSVMMANSVLDTNVNFGSSTGLDTVNNTTYTMNSTKNDANPIYYYRGNVTANNVIFGDYCWKMVRTTETSGVKLIYNGVPAADGSCNNTGTASQIGTSSFNDVASNGYASPADISYMYGVKYISGKANMNPDTNSYVYGNDVEWDGSNYKLIDTMQAVWADNYQDIALRHHYTCLNSTGVCQQVLYFYSFNLGSVDSYYITLTDGKNIEDAKNDMFNPINDSVIKSVLDNWYKNNLDNYTNLLEDAIWCNDKTISDGGLKSKDSSGLDHGYTISGNRTATGTNPSLECVNQNDAYTVSNPEGNSALTYPVGLLTADELTLAGSGRKGHSTSSYLHTGQYWRTMTPYFYNNTNPSMFSKHEESRLTYQPSSYIYGVRPAISLMSNMLIASGDGTVNSPYHIRKKITLDLSYYGYDDVYYEPGMTWEEWVNSEYNTVGFVVDDDYIADEYYTNYVEDSSDTRILASTVINSSETYGLRAYI